MKEEKFRIPSKNPIERAPKVYLIYKGEKYPLHPRGFFSSSSWEFSSFPSSKEWQILFQFFPLDVIEFSYYYTSLWKDLSLEERRSLMEGFLGAYNPLYEEVIKKIPFLDPLSQSLIKEKELPLKYVSLWMNLSSSYKEELSSLLLQEEIKKNIAKEIFLLFMELREEKRRIFLEEAKKYISSLSPRMRIYMGEGLRKILYEIRYPLLSRYREKIQKKISSFPLPPFIKIEWDKNLERVGFRLVFSIDREKTLEELEKYLAPSLREFCRELYYEIEGE